MVKPRQDEPNLNSAYKNEHSAQIPVQIRTAESEIVRAIPIDILKTFEVRLQQKRILDPNHLSFGSIWFLAETEKNICLWRRGCSIAEEQRFNFYVNVPALVRKRISQLDSETVDSPFVNPLWGLVPPSTELLQLEKEYHLSFLSIWSKVEEHLLALRAIRDIIEWKTQPNANTTREVVILPG